MSNRTMLSVLLSATVLATPLMAQDYSLRVAHTNAANEVQDMGLQKMEEILKDKTAGKVSIQDFPGGQLGDEQQLVESVMLGSLDMAMVSNAMMSNYVKDYKVFDMPFLFPSVTDLGNKIDANFDLMQKDANAAGFQLIAVYSSGVRNLMTDKPVDSMSDLKGMKIRTMQNPVHVAAFRDYGANPTPMSYSELYGALQSGVVDGAEAASTGYDGMKFYEVAKNYAVVGWLNMTAPIVMQKSAFDALPKDVQDDLMQAGHDSAVWQRQYVVDQEEPLLEKFKKLGVNITHPDLAPFKAASEPLYKQELTTKGQQELLKAMTGE